MPNEMLQAVRQLISKYKNHYEISPDSVPLSSPTFGEDEILAAVEVLASSFVTNGKRVKQFEKEFAEYIGKKYAVMVNSGSSANLLLISSLLSPHCGLLHKGDEVIVPAVTWPTTIYPLAQMGLKPILVDCDLETLNISPKKIRQAITKKTKALMVVPILGNPCQMDEIKNICDESGILLLEDTCESLGSEFKEKKCGSFGEAATFSFFFSHHMTCIEGGMIVTDNKKLADTLLSQRSHGWTRDMLSKDEINSKYSDFDSRFLFVDMGFNLRSTELNAAMASIQLKKLPQMNQSRIDLAHELIKRLDKFSTYFQFVQSPKESINTWFGFPFLLKKSAPFRRKDFTQHLESHNIETRPITGGNLSLQPAFELFDWETRGDLVNAQYIQEQGIYIGTHPGMNTDHIAHIENTFASFIVKNRP